MQADILAVGVSFEELLRAAVANGGGKVPPEGVEAWIASVLEQRRRTTETAFESRLSNGWWLRISERRTIDGLLVGSHTDITELKERERLIEEKSALLQTTLDNMKQGIVVFDDDMNLLLFNNQYLTINEYPEEITEKATHYRDLVALATWRGDYAQGDVHALANSPFAAFQRTLRIP